MVKLDKKLEDMRLLWDNILIDKLHNWYLYDNVL